MQTCTQPSNVGTNFGLFYIDTFDSGNTHIIIIGCHKIIMVSYKVFVIATFHIVEKSVISRLLAVFVTTPLGIRQHIWYLPRQDKVGGLRQESIRRKMGGEGGGSLVSPDGVAPGRMASVIFPCFWHRRTWYSPAIRTVKRLCVCVCVCVCAGVL